MARRLYLAPAEGSRADVAFGAVRIAVSVVLIWGALTKLLIGERIGELAGVWATSGVPQPTILITISIGLQLILALLLLVGMFTRKAGLLSGVNFAVSAAISGIFTSGQHWWPFALLIVLLLHFGLAGAGRLSVDAVRARRAGARSLEDLMRSMGIKPNSGNGNDPGQSGY